MIDENIEQPWPEEVRHAVASFKQGDLVERPPFVYIAFPQYGIWALSRGDDTETEVLIEVDREDSPAYGLITTQTCDLVEEDRAAPREPWFQVAPVYDASGMDAGKRGYLRKDRIGHLIELTGRDLPDGLWVADFRIEVPVEKSWLIGKQPLAGFEDESGYLRLAQRLAGRRARPALAGILIEHVVSPLRRWLGGMNRQRARQLRDPVHELRLAVAGNRLHPDGATLVVLTESDPLPEGVRRAWDDWWEETHETAKAAGLPLLANRYETLRSVSAQDYLEAVPLDFGYLSPND